MAPTYTGVAGTGTPGANQDGPHPTGPAHSPGEIVNVGQGLAYQAPSPKVSVDLQQLFVNRAFDLAVRTLLRDRLIFDQFATVKPTKLTHQGSPVRMFLGEDIVEDTAGVDGGPLPLLENIDVDSVAFGARGIDMTPLEYGRAVTRTRLFGALSMVNIDPQIVSRVAYDAGRAVDTLARIALLAPSATYVIPDAAGLTTKVVTAATIPAGATSYLSTTTLQIAIGMLQQQNVMPFRGDQYVLLTGPVGAQHLKNERDTGGFRYVVARNEGDYGNSIFRGQIGMIEGADVVISNRMPAGKSLLIGMDALAKTHANSDGYSAAPQTIVAPVVDKLRRFLSWGWLHFVDYGLFDARAVVQISHTTGWRPAGTGNLGDPAGTPVPVVW